MSDESIKQRTGRILGAVLGGKIVHRDVRGAPPATHDFDVRLSDGRVIAVEVTISTDRKVAAFWRAASNRSRSWRTSRLQHSWLLNVTPPRNIKELFRRVVPLLHKLEQAHIHEFGLGSVATRPEIQQLHRLGVKSGGVLHGALPGRIFLYSTSAGSVGTDAVRKAVEHEAWKQDNRCKLGRATADERHLFVWIDPLNTLPAAAFGSHAALPSACSLPPEIDVVWVAISTVGKAGKPGERVWRCDRQKGWQVVR